MAEEKRDKVSFYIRSDFGVKDDIEYRWIIRGDSCGLRHYIVKFMQTHEKKRKIFGNYIYLCQKTNQAHLLTHKTPYKFNKNANFFINTSYKYGNLSIKKV